MRLLVNAPINALSFGNVSVNILRELYKKNVDLIFFPIGDKAELDAYDKIDNEFIIEKDFEKELEIMAALLTKRPDWGMEIRSYTDSRGPKVKNKKLK
jgi:hypothetical protein